MRRRGSPQHAAWKLWSFPTKGGPPNESALNVRLKDSVVNLNSAVRSEGTQFPGIRKPQVRIMHGLFPLAKTAARSDGSTRAARRPAVIHLIAIASPSLADLTKEVEELQRALLELLEFKETYNRRWLIERLGYKTPWQARQDLLAEKIAA